MKFYLVISKYSSKFDTRDSEPVIFTELDAILRHISNIPGNHTIYEVTPPNLDQRGESIEFKGSIKLITSTTISDIPH